MRQPTLRLLFSRPCRSQLFHSSAGSCIRVSKTLWSDKQGPDDAATPSNTQTPIPENKPLITRYVVGRKSDKVEEEEDVPWDSPSLGRSTTTNQVTSDAVSEADDIQFDMAKSYDPFEEEEDMFSQYEGEPDFTIPSARKPGESTITLEERDTFQSIFSDIYARSQNSRPQPQSLVDLSEVNQENAREKLHSIMEEAVRLPQNTLFTSQPREKNLDTLKQYPIALRAVAARALGLEGKSSRTNEPPQEKPVDKYKEFRQQEQERVEAAMRAAPTDIALWAVMEKEVFSLIPRLGLEERKATVAPPPKKRGPKTSRKKAAEMAVEEPTGVTPAAEPLDINLYFPLYASYLLYGLRLLHHSFAKHSPLACNVLPRIKSLGLVSHVLGGTTALYNELLRIYWFQYDDFNGVIRLLEEMEESGLELDEETLDVVTDIQQMQVRYLFSREQKAQRTPIHLLWTMNEFAPGRFKSWQTRIRDTLDREE